MSRSLSDSEVEAFIKLCNACDYKDSHYNIRRLSDQSILEEIRWKTMEYLGDRATVSIHIKYEGDDLMITFSCTLKGLMTMKIVAGYGNLDKTDLSKRFNHMVGQIEEAVSALLKEGYFTKK